MPISQLLSPLLGALIGDQYPQQNPNYLDENGNPVRGQLPYKTPGFGTRMFHPDVAAQEGAYNNQSYNAFLQNQITNAINAKKFSDTQPYAKVDPSSGNVPPLIGGQLLGGDTTYRGYQSGANTAADLAQGNPNIRAVDTNELGKESIKSSISRQVMGVPNLGAQAESSRLSFIPEQVSAARSLLTPQTQVEGNRLNRELNAKDIIDRAFMGEARTRESQANTGLGLAQTDESMLPEQQDTRRKTLAVQDYLASRVPTSGSPISQFVNSDNTISAPRPDPAFVNEKTALMMRMAEDMKGAGTPNIGGQKILDIGGKGVPPMVPKPDFDPHTGLPIVRPTIAQPPNPNPPVPINPQMVEGATQLNSRGQGIAYNQQQREQQQIKQLQAQLVDLTQQAANPNLNPRGRTTIQGSISRIQAELDSLTKK